MPVCEGDIKKWADNWMLLSDITSLYWSGGKPTVTCARSYETEECHGLLCCYYMFMGDDVMVTGQWTHLGHTHTHTHTHIMCPLTALLLAGMFVFMTLLFFASEVWCGSVIVLQWVTTSLCLYFSLLCRKNDASMSERRGRKMPSFLTSLLVSSHSLFAVSFFQNSLMLSLTLFSSIPPFSLHSLFSSPSKHSFSADFVFFYTPSS